jgi:hypothetical protein
MMRRPSNVLITWFVIVWLSVFLYETFRAGYLSPLVHRPLPKLPLLFPPAGWIMFYNVDTTYGFAEVYALRGRDPVPLDPHAIFTTRSVGYDNIRRNLLVGVLSQREAPLFCGYLGRKFPEAEGFLVIYAQYPDVVETPDRVDRMLAYRCR